MLAKLFNHNGRPGDARLVLMKRGTTPLKRAFLCQVSLTLGTALALINSLSHPESFGRAVPIYLATQTFVSYGVARFARYALRVGRRGVTENGWFSLAVKALVVLQLQAAIIAWGWWMALNFRRGYRKGWDISFWTASNRYMADSANAVTLLSGAIHVYTCYAIFLALHLDMFATFHHR